MYASEDNKKVRNVIISVGFLYDCKREYLTEIAGRRSAVGSASDSRARGPGFDTRSGHILSFFLPLIQEGQLSVTGESMCTKYWLIAYEV